MSEGDETACRCETDHLMTWCGQKYLVLHALKTVEMPVDFRENPAPPTPVTLCGFPVNVALRPPEHHCHPGPPIEEHQLPNKEGAAEDILPMAAEEVQPAKFNNGTPLHCYH